MNKEIFTKGFWRVSCQEHFDKSYSLPSGVTESIVIEKRSSLGGVQYEFKIKWYRMDEKTSTLRLEIFEDALIAMRDNEVLFKMLTYLKHATPDDIQSLLLDLGYEDFSDNKIKPKRDCGVDTYICYVQNYLGIMDGEDVVSNMKVFVNQEDIDDWYVEQIAEAKEAGFEPQDDASTYIGINDYELCVSKGNEEEGFVNYGIICRPYRMQL